MSAHNSKLSLSKRFYSLPQNPSIRDIGLTPYPAAVIFKIDPESNFGDFNDMKRITMLGLLILDCTIKTVSTYD